MNNFFFKTNLTAVLTVFLFIGTLFSGCTQQTVVVNGNAAAINETVNVNKNAASATPANAADASQDKAILWDFRKNSNTKPEKFPKAETDVVLKYLLGDSWDKDLEIASRVSGAFTKANAKETLYFVTGCEDENGKLVSNGNEACSHATWDSAGWIAIFDGTTPVLKIKKSLGNRVEKVTDVNGDGINEFLSFGGFTNMGETIERGLLGQISGSDYQQIKELNGWSDDCGSTLKDKKAAASVISYTPTGGGKMPEFSEEYFQTKCAGDEIGKNPQWTKMTKKEFEDFTNENS